MVSLVSVTGVTSDGSVSADSVDKKQLKHASGKSSLGSLPAELRILRRDTRRKKTDEAGLKNPPFSCAA